MYIAELKGKLSSTMENKEDVLTSNVFSFFKYSSRVTFLKPYLKSLGICVSDEEASGAEFMFWPRFEENTEPDLVIMVGSYDLLIEAKYFSGFGESPRKDKNQLIREIKGGRFEAHNYGKSFCYIAITKDHYFKKEKFALLPSEFQGCFKWRNWQAVSAFLYDTLAGNEPIDPRDRLFAQDLYDLLDKKNLRDFDGSHFRSINLSLEPVSTIFFDAKKAGFRGGFIGFVNALMSERQNQAPKTTLFYKRGRAIFDFSLAPTSLKPLKENIFLRRKNNE